MMLSPAGTSTLESEVGPRRVRRRSMASDTATILRNVEGLFAAGTTCGLTDGELLERFASSRGVDDEVAQAAFTALVDRHGNMVPRTCRRILCEDRSAEDTAQAALLGLARQARTILRKESLAAWLHGVAVRTASKERRATIRRRARESRYGELAVARSFEQARRESDPDRWAEL